MGILNVTPDSFYSGSRHTQSESLLPQAEKMLREGADFLDIGGYSSRPQATDISPEEEIQRVVPAIELVKKTFPEAILSIDTFRSGVAGRALDAGAEMVNDISGGLLDEEMFQLVARWKVPYIMMHMRGTPQTMTTFTEYENVVKEVLDYFHQRIGRLQNLQVADIVIDPGFGFAKNVSQNFEMLRQLQQLRILGKPVLVGISRKSMIWKALQSDPENALNGTTALHAIALLKGADILRVHDVKEAKEVVKLINFAR